MRDENEFQEGATNPAEEAPQADPRIPVPSDPAVFDTNATLRVNTYENNTSVNDVLRFIRSAFIDCGIVQRIHLGSGSFTFQNEVAEAMLLCSSKDLFTKLTVGQLSAFKNRILYFGYTDVKVVRNSEESISLFVKPPRRERYNQVEVVYVPSCLGLTGYLKGFRGNGMLLQRLIESTGLTINNGKIYVKPSFEGAELAPIYLADDLFALDFLLGTGHTNRISNSFASSSVFRQCLYRNPFFSLSSAGLNSNLENTIPNPTAVEREFQEEIRNIQRGLLSGDANSYNNASRNNPFPAEAFDIFNTHLQEYLSGGSISNQLQESLNRLLKDQMCEDRVKEAAAVLNRPVEELSAALSDLEAYTTRRKISFTAFLLQRNPFTLARLLESTGLLTRVE